MLKNYFEAVENLPRYAKLTKYFTCFQKVLSYFFCPLINTSVFCPYKFCILFIIVFQDFWQLFLDLIFGQIFRFSKILNYFFQSPYNKDPQSHHLGNRCRTLTLHLSALYHSDSLPRVLCILTWGDKWQVLGEH